MTAPRAHAPVVVVSGMAGIGKTGFALHAAHQVRPDFPDGQLYLDLHGATPGATPLDPARALAALLRDLGVGPGLVPADSASASALLRTVLADSRTLLVLDDAASAAQVRPLLPAGPGCAVLVTSRQPLATLGAAVRLRLGTLSPEEGVRLLRSTSGREWTPADAAPVARLAALCGRLPLALKVVAARLATRTALPVEDLVARLSAHEDRLDHLELDDLSVRRTLAGAHDALAASPLRRDRDAALALVRLGALDLPEYTAPQLARLCGICLRRAEAALDRLEELALVEPVSTGRHAPHDLVRAYARELARRPHEEAPGPRPAA
ncbi:NB-ARC domain-containing protein [Streptomyces sp. NPDC090077]|uniref:NB-ARC domain-containing protein n=1 Tax=Streptomyces sp. NPDC090077 TaxID=3365938 RepID=UPI003823BA82